MLILIRMPSRPPIGLLLVLGPNWDLAPVKHLLHARVRAYAHTHAHVPAHAGGEHTRTQIRPFYGCRFPRCRRLRG